MRDTLKRLERLEAIATPGDPMRTIIQLIGVKEGGGPEPWNPTWAEGEDGTVIRREDGEAGEAFEDRALVHFPAGRIIMGCRPDPAR